MGTAERRLKLMKLLCHRRYETMENLAFEFGVSVRTILRDIDEISDMIPVFCKKGRYGGGVYIDENYNMDRVYMSDNELNLLKKVSEIAKTGEKIYLSDNEQQLLNNIIIDYSIPCLKK